MTINRKDYQTAAGESKLPRLAPGQRYAEAKVKIQAGFVNAMPGEILALSQETFDYLRAWNPASVEWLPEPKAEEAEPGRSSVPGAPPAKDKRRRATQDSTKKK